MLRATFLLCSSGLKHTSAGPFGLLKQTSLYRLRLLIRLVGFGPPENVLNLGDFAL